MEDAATAEICWTQIWQWVRHGALLDDGRTVTRALVRGMLDEEMSRLGVRPGRAAGSDRLSEARALFKFVTLAGFHALDLGMYDLARRYRDAGMSAYSELQQREVAAEAEGYSATRHQREAGTGYFDEVARVISGGGASTLALGGSTEKEQF